MRKQAQHDLTKGSVSLSLLKLTAPMTLAVSATILVQTVEMGFIGQLSAEHLAAMTFTFPITMILMSIALGIGIGTSSVIARSVGSGDREDVQRLATHAILLVGGIMAVLALIGWASIDPVFTAMGAPASLLPLIRSYLDIYYAGAVLFTVSMVAGSVMRASGNANVPGMVMTLGALLNLAIDPILIFGWFGFPRMELAGAATAMTLTRVIMALVLFRYVLRGGLMKTVNVLERFAESSRRILHVGIPAMATQLIGPVSVALITRLVAGHGEAVVAGFGVATRIESLAVIALFALSGSIGPFVGQNWGGGRLDRVREGLRVSCIFSCACGLVGAGALFLFGHVFAAWMNEDPQVLSAAVFYLATVPWSHGFWGVLMMTSACFNALGKPIPSTALSFARMFALNIPLAIAFNELFGYRGIFIAGGLSNCLMGIAGYLWFHQLFFARK